MKAATISQIKKELALLPKEDLINICLDLGKYKKENKELMSYLLFEKANEENYILQLKIEIEEEFKLINVSSYYFIKKSVRKILRIVKKHIKYSKKKETEVELLIHFCEQLNNLKPSRKNNVTLNNLFDRQVILLEKAKNTLHEDLQYDFEERIGNLKGYY
jgi:hypothetical protein